MGEEIKSRQQSKLNRFNPFYEPKRRQGLRLHKLNPVPYRLFALGLAAFVLTFLASSLFMAPELSTAQDFTVNNTATSYTLTVSSNHSAASPVSIELTPGATTPVTSTDTVTTVTNAPGGYQLYLSMNSDSSNGNRLYLNGTVSDDSPYIPAASGTYDTPAALSSSSWGYATTAANVENKLYAGVPLKTSAQKISEGDATDSEGDEQNVYYAALASSTQASGTYSNTVLYTALAESPSLASVSPSKLTLAGGQITIATSFSTAAEDLGDATVSLLKNGEEKASCDDVSLSVENGFVYATCTAPRLVSGTFSVKLTLEKFTQDFTAADALTYVAADGETDTMQDFTMSMCSALDTGTKLPLLDSRDDKEYYVLKAADGNCWMTDNLKYDIADSSSWTTNDYSQNLLHIATNEGYTGEYYYNWPAAVESCPNGWSLPVNGDSTVDKSWAKLMNVYSITSSAELLANSDLGFTDYYGYYRYQEGSEYGQGTIASFRTSTPSDTGAASAYDLYYSDSDFLINNLSAYGTGRSVRCVFTGQEDEIMQNFTLSECSAMDTGDKKYLYDVRDNSRYAIVKAADGNCWMADNLKIADQTIRAEDSDFAQGTFTLPASSTWSESVTDSAKLHIAETYGYVGEVYYNSYAATAGSTVSSGSTGSSICPKGWTLPTSSGTLSWANLINAYGYTTGPQLIGNSKLGFDKYYGNWNYGYNTEGGQGSFSHIWTQTASGSIALYVLRYNSDSISTSYTIGGARGYGNPVRCVLDSRTVSDIAYMQQMSPAICSNTSTGTTATLRDRRGRGSAGGTSTGYGVIKAADGNCWMTTNFDLYNIALTPELSDFSSGSFTLPASTNWNTNLYTAAKVHKATNSGYTDQVYYNWCSAVALSDCSTTHQQDRSVCPKGWRLPINGEYGTLLSSYSVTTGPQLLANSTLGFSKYHGYWDWNTVSEGNQNSNGYFQTSTPYGSGYNYLLNYYTTGVATTGTIDKGYGLSIRCLAR